MKMFSETMKFYKANFHCHTTESDGKLTPAEAAAGPRVVMRPTIRFVRVRKREWS